MGRVEGKIALVTGGASGLGRGIATLLAAEGANVVITDVDVERGEETAEAIGALGCKCRFQRQDVSSETEWKTIFGGIVKDEGGLDILVNNAGTAMRGAPSDPETTEIETWRKLNAVNTEGVFLGCKHAIPAMRDSGGGSIVNLSSVAALVATPFITAYGASKAAVRQLTKSVALHCAQNGYGIRCNSVHPGQIKTEMLVGLFEDAAAGAGVDVAEVEGMFLQKIPIGEFGTPEDIAQAVLFLASDESKHVTGAKLVVDGGMTLNP